MHLSKTEAVEFARVAGIEEQSRAGKTRRENKATVKQ